MENMAENQKKRIQAEKDARLVNPIVKETPHGGDQIPNTDLGYPMEEVAKMRESRKIGKSSPAPVIEGE